MVSGMIKVVCGTITGVVSLINIVTMIVALSHSSNLTDGTLTNKILYMSQLSNSGLNPLKILHFQFHLF